MAKSLPITKGKGTLTTAVDGSSTTISFQPSDTSRALTSVTMADFGDYGYLVINPKGKASNYQVVRFDDWNVTSGIITVDVETLALELEGTDTSATGGVFAAGTTVVIGTNHHWFNNYMNLGSAQTVAGVKTFSSSPVVPTPSSATDAANKSYVDSVAIAGGADASTTVKGISKLSTAPASATDPIAVGTNDTRIPTQDENNALVGTSGTPSTSNKYVTDDDTTATPTANAVVRGNGSGKIDGGWASNVANGLVSLNGSTQLPTSSAILLTDVLRQFVASDDLLISSNGETTETATSYALKKTIVVNFGGTYRVKFDLSGNTNGLGYGRVYRNGVALGTEQSQNGPTNSASDYVTKTEDLVFAAGDSIQIYQKAQSTATSYVRNFRVYGTTTTTLTYGYAF